MKKPETYFKPYHSKRSFEDISDEIKKLIFKGVFKPEEKLPPESEIARQFNVSRHTIREAMRILEQSGFITIRQGHNGGPYITDTVMNRISSLFIDLFNYKNVSIDELTEARFDIMKVILFHVIERADQTDIDALKENIQIARSQLENNIAPFEMNVNFHKLLARSSKNYIFVIVTESIMAVMSDFHTRQPKDDLEKSRKLLKYHEYILEQIIARNYNAVIDLVNGLLEETGYLLKGQ